MTRPKYKGKRFQLFLGKCENVLKELPSNSVHSIVCDPPYELGFMGKSWDASGIAYNVDMWKEAMRVLKPGGYLLAFSGSRTYHRMVCAIEDAGFEIRDQIMWIYSSGFPKSQNVSKAIDKAAGAEREVVGIRNDFAARANKKPHSNNATNKGFVNPHDVGSITAPATDDAKEWDGWGTALKPAHEPICVARKPFKGTVVKNVLKHRTGAVNIDACRVETADKLGGGKLSGSVKGGDGWNRPWMDDPESIRKMKEDAKTRVEKAQSLGRWPANVVHDGSTDVQDAFARFGKSKSRKGKPRGSAKPGEGWGMTKTGAEYNDEGSPARFFYCAKASQKDRDDGLDAFIAKDSAVQNASGRRFDPICNNTGKRIQVCPCGKCEWSKDTNPKRKNSHPTVKPTELMRYLVRLVTPPNGIVLDPFMGSGSTGKACMLEGFKFAGIDMSSEYVELSYARITHALTKEKK